MKKQVFQRVNNQLFKELDRQKKSQFIRLSTWRNSQPPWFDFALANKFSRIWIFFSGSVILFNKWVLDTAGFRIPHYSFLLMVTAFPIFLTTWHLIFATICTRLLARTTTLLDGLKTVKMTGKTYLRAIVPIGFFFSISLICSNQAYLYLSVAFIQMLKVFEHSRFLWC